MFRNRLTRSLVGAGVTAAAGLALLAAPMNAEAAPQPKCVDASCIVDLTVQPHGLSIGVTLDTAPDTTAALTVYKGGTLAGQASDATLRKAHTMTTLANLTAGTIYTWHARATDSRGNSFERTGEVSTLHRRVTVQFTSVTVTNDSDTYGAGEFTTMVSVPGSSQFPPLLPRSISTGDTKLMGAVLQQRDAGTTTLIRTEMIDDDIPFSTDPMPASAFGWGAGTAYMYGDWATASGTVNTAVATAGLVPFQLSVNSYVGFVVHGYYSVDFVS